MFTGIISSIGTVASRTRHTLSVRARQNRHKPGASIAVNGACLTVTKYTSGVLSFDVSDETWNLTNLGFLKAGQIVNLEPALRAGDTLGGHLVSGHVDARGKVLALAALKEDFWLLRVSFPPALRGLIARKGSVCVDGISLTITKTTANYFEVALVPYTMSHTNLSTRKVGEFVNLEADLLARYVRSVLENRP